MVDLRVSITAVEGERIRYGVEQSLVRTASCDDVDDVVVKREEKWIACRI